VDRRGMPNFFQLILFAREFSDVVRFTHPPPLVQTGLFALVAPFARLLGYRGSYQEYLTRRQEHYVAARPARPLRTFLATGADNQEVAGWMAARANARQEQFFGWCRRLQATNAGFRFLQPEDWLDRRRSRRNQS
jgi:hypothetical protein